MSRKWLSDIRTESPCVRRTYAGKTSILHCAKFIHHSSFISKSSHLISIDSVAPEKKMTVVHSILYHRLNRRTGPSSNSREAATVTSFPANCDAAPRVLACSAYVSQHLDLLFPSRKLCEDRRGFFEHLSMNSLVKSVSNDLRSQTSWKFRNRILTVELCKYKKNKKQTIKVTATVGSTTLTNYFSDQLREEIIRDENLKRGKLRPDEAEQEADEWAEVRECYSNRMLLRWMHSYCQYAKYCH